MAALPSSSHRSEQVGRRLYELLEQPQEPFVMQVYLLQNGCSGRIIRSHSSPSCWPLNAAGRRLRKLGSHGGGIRRSRAAGLLRRALVKLVYSKAVRKVLHLNRKRSSFFDFFSVESKDQLSPVSVLELQHSHESSPSDKPNEYPLLPSIDSPREISITLKETKAKSLSRKKVKFSNRRGLLFECLREAEKRIWSFHGCLDSDLFEEAMNEQLSPSWERRKGDATNLNSRFREEWNQFKPEVREIGLCLEASILDDLKEEAILDMFNPNYH